MVTDEGFLFIEPVHSATAPIIDDITRAATALLRSAIPSPLRYRGWHTCRCGATSDNTDHILPDGRKTHSLVVHYVARHRDEVPAAAIAELSKLAVHDEPSAEEIQ